MSRVAVIGAGIAGLSAAYRLHRAGLEVTVYEAGNRPGGVIRTVQQDGFLIELGPNSIRSGPPVLDRLIEELSLETEIVEAQAASARYVVRNGNVTELPSSPPALLGSRLFSTAGKLRLLWEPFVPPGPAGKEESVAEFVRRRLGEEALHYGADPFVAGTFAGVPDHLSLRHAFPVLFELEQQHGSLLKGLIRKARTMRRTEDRVRRRIFSFRQGLQQLPRALAGHVGNRLHTNSPVTGLEHTAQGWSLTIGHEKQHHATAFDAVICTVPLHRLAHLNLNIEQDTTLLRQVSYPPVAIVALGFRRDDVAHSLNGFGLLVPRVESSFRILGTIFSSSLYEGRAPDGHVLLTTLVGGARHPDHALKEADAAVELVQNDLTRLLGLRGAPTFRLHHLWRHAIPQYHVGYGAVKKLLNRIESQNPGLFMAGNYRDGISIGEAVASGYAAAERLINRLGH